MGPLKHLEKEVKEMQERPYDLEEKIDGIFLIVDAIRRSGATYPDMMNMLWAKLAKNKARKWGAPSADGVIEHIRGQVYEEG